MNFIAILSAAESKGFIIDFSNLLGDGFLQVLSILLLFFILAKLLFNPVRNILEKRKESIANELDTIKKDKKDTEALKADYESKLANIQQEADEIMKDTYQKAKDKEKEIVNEAKDEADRILNRAKIEIDREKEKARDELKGEIVQIATAMATKFIVSSMDEKVQKELVEETINEMGDNTWQN